MVNPVDHWREARKLFGDFQPRARVSGGDFQSFVDLTNVFSSVRDGRGREFRGAPPHTFVATSTASVAYETANQIVCDHNGKHPIWRFASDFCFGMQNVLNR